MISINDSSPNKCIEKCDCIMYSSRTNYTAQNNANKFFNITPQSDNPSKINFYGKNNTFAFLSIYSKPMHNFSGENGNTPDGEIIIDFGSSAICIPFGKSGSNTHGSNLLASIITTCCKQLPSSSGANNATSNVPEFSLLDLVPIDKPFETYDSNNGDSNKTQKQYSVIVFSIKYCIYLNSSIFDNLFKVLNITPDTPTYCLEKNLILYDDIYQFENKIGITNGNLGDDIYIDCSPTGQSEEEDVLINKSDANADASFEITKNIFTNKLFQAMLFGIIVLGVLIALYYGTNALSGKNHLTRPFRNVLTNKFYNNVAP